MPYAYKNVYKHVDNVDNLFAKELFANIYNVSGAHGYQQVALCTMFHDKFFYFIERRQIPCFFSFFF